MVVVPSILVLSVKVRGSEAALLNGQSPLSETKGIYQGSLTPQVQGDMRSQQQQGSAVPETQPSGVSSKRQLEDPFTPYPNNPTNRGSFPQGSYSM